MLKYRITLQRRDGKRTVIALTDFNDVAVLMRDTLREAYQLTADERIDVQDCDECRNFQRELHLARRPSEQMTAKEAEACAET